NRRPTLARPTHEPRAARPRETIGQMARRWLTAGRLTERAGSGWGRRDPFQPSERRRPSVWMEPSRQGAAHACRVVLSTPTAPGPLRQPPGRRPAGKLEPEISP